jgi:hypothetical protein
MISQGYADLLILDINPGGIVVIFAKKQEKIWKQIISKIDSLKKRKKYGGGSKIRNNA